MTMAIDVVGISLTGGSFEFSIDTKAAEDAGDGSPITASKKTVTAAGRAAQTVSSASTGMKDLVRYHYEFLSGSAAGDWVLFRMLEPSWYDSVDTTP